MCAQQNQICGAQVEALIEADHQAGDFLEEPDAVLQATLGKAFRAEALGTELGSYRLLYELGRGGMGVVYEAEEIILGRRVALKILPFAALLNQSQLERFNTEATAAARLQHDNIVQVYSVGCERGIHFLPCS